MIGSGGERLRGVVGEDQHADLFAGTIRERRGAAHVLVARRRIDAETKGKLDGLVEFSLREFGKDLDRFFKRIILREISDLDGAVVAFALGMVTPCGANVREDSRGECYFSADEN
jgi:hypothetical protein